MANTAPITLEQLFRFFNRGLPHQLAAISELEADLKANGYAAAMRRDRPWFKTWSTDHKQDDLSAALKIVKEFEGTRLQAYPDPLSGGEPWTIGVGCTRYPDGSPVRSGDVITEVEADQMLRLEIDRTAALLAKRIPYWSEMNANQKSALISFAFNLGPNFFGASGFGTITRVLHDKQWDRVPDAMLLYRNPGTNVEAGLKRRRLAEGDLWGRVRQTSAPFSAMFTPESPFSFKVTPHFTAGEFALGDPARRFDHQHQCDTALKLAQFLERVRAQFGGKRVTITSGYRPPAINRQVGGASSSEHLYAHVGEGAVDFFVDGADIYAVQDWCDKNWPYSLGFGAPKGFVHLGIRQGAPRVRWDY